MEKSIFSQIKRRKHKSQVLTKESVFGKVQNKKRLSAKSPSQVLMIEESQGEVANFIIQKLLQDVFNSLNLGKQMSRLCISQVEQKVSLLQKFQLFNIPCESVQSQMTNLIITPQPQPAIQPKHKVIKNRQPTINSQVKINLVQNNPHDTNQNSIVQLQLVTSSPSNHSIKNSNKFLSKDKLSKLTTLYGSSNKSINSKRGNSYALGSYKPSHRIEEEKQDSKEKQRRQREQIIKKLMRQYQSKLKQTNHLTPEPIQQQYRSFFIHPQTREQQDFRASFLHRRQILQNQEQLTRHKTYKKTSASMLLQQNKENIRSTKLPAIYKTKQEKPVLFAQDQNGSIIKIKNNQRLESQSRQHSMTTHQSVIIKPQQSQLKSISNTYTQISQFLKNDKIKDQSLFLNQNASVLSTVCHTFDEDHLDKSLMQSFVQKQGVKLKKSTYSHRTSASMDLQAVKLPSIMMKKR